MSYITVAEMGRRVARVDTESAVIESIVETEKQFIELQTDQLYNGYMSNGNKIEPPYAESTVKQKRKKGQPTDRVTFKDKGDFYGEMTAAPDNDVIRIGSGVPYEKYITQRSGTGIYGLDDQNRKIYIWTDLFPKIKQRIERLTKLLFR